MAKFTVKFGGLTIETDDPAALRDLILLGNMPAVNGKPAGRGPRLMPTTQQNANQANRTTNGVLAVLREISSSDKTFPTRDLVRLFGCKKVKGFGGFSAGLRNRLKNTSIEFEDALGYQRIRGNGFWVKGPKIDQAIEVVKAALVPEA